MSNKIQQSKIISKSRTGYGGWSPDKMKGDEGTITSFEENAPSLVVGKEKGEAGSSQDSVSAKKKITKKKSSSSKVNGNEVVNSVNKKKSKSANTNNKSKSIAPTSSNEVKHVQSDLTHENLLELFNKYPFDDIYPTIKSSKTEECPTTIFIDSFFIDDLVFDIMVKAKKSEKRKITNKEIFTRGIIQSFKYHKENKLLNVWSKQNYPLGNTSVTKPAAALYNESVKYMFVELTLARWQDEHKHTNYREILERAILMVADFYGVKY